MTRRTLACASLALALAGLARPTASLADALPFLPPGDARLRHLVELAADDGEIPIAGTWPIPTLDVPAEMRDELHSQQQPGTGADAGWFLSAAGHPDQIRTFDETPREKGEAGLQAGWAAGDYAGGVFRMSYTYQPQDGMHYRFDDSYVAWRFGNWWVTAGQQERWWGPGWDGSLILSNNARPMPQVALERASATPFETPWLSWLGPWRLTTFMGLEQHVSEEYPNPLLWGIRATARPLRDIEIGLSVTEQWCRVGVCRLRDFLHAIEGKNYAGVNTSTAEAPGNGELDWDLRWRLGAWPSALYWQIQGETVDAAQPLLPRPRQTTDILGLELWSETRGAGGWRTFLEWAGTTCNELSLQTSIPQTPGCAYTNSIVTFGYYYRDRVIGDSIQGDGRMLTLGGLYLDGEDRTWELRLRRGVLNRYSVAGVIDWQPVNTLASVNTGIWNVEAKLDGHWRGFTYSAGIGATRMSPADAAPSRIGEVFLTISRPWAP
jgi:hypothetical protein